MLNTIKMDLYRMFKSKVFYVTIIIALFCMIASMTGAKYEVEHPEYQDMIKEAMEQADDMDMNIGIQAGGAGLVTEDTPTEDLFAGVYAGGVILVMGIIFCVVFVCTEHNSGFIKNVASRKGYRSQTSISKAITMVVYSLILFAVSIGMFLLLYLILFGGFQFASVGNFLRYMAMQLLIQVGLMNLCIVFCNLVRNMAFSMAFGICVSVGLFSLITSLIDKFNLPFNTTDYLLSVLMRQLPLTYDSTIYIRALIVSIVSIVIYQFASFITMKKQDIK